MGGLPRAPGDFELLCMLVPAASPLSKTVLNCKNKSRSCLLFLLGPLKAGGCRCLSKIAWAAAWRGGFGCSSCVSELEEVQAAEMPLSLCRALVLPTEPEVWLGWCSVEPGCCCSTTRSRQQNQQGLCSCRTHKIPE